MLPSLGEIRASLQILAHEYGHIRRRRLSQSHILCETYFHCRSLWQPRQSLSDVEDFAERRELACDDYAAGPVWGSAAHTPNTLSTLGLTERSRLSWQIQQP